MGQHPPTHDRTRRPRPRPRAAPHPTWKRRPRWVAGRDKVENGQAGTNKSSARHGSRFTVPAPFAIKFWSWRWNEEQGEHAPVAWQRGSRSSTNPILPRTSSQLQTHQAAAGPLPILDALTGTLTVPRHVGRQQGRGDRQEGLRVGTQWFSPQTGLWKT